MKGQSQSRRGQQSIAVVPLTIPLLTGPATISTMVIYAEKTPQGFWEHAARWWAMAWLLVLATVLWPSQPRPTGLRKRAGPRPAST